MRRRQLVRMILLGALAEGLWSPLQSLLVAQGQPNSVTDSLSPANAKHSAIDAQVPQTAGKFAEIIDRMIAQEQEQIKALEGHTPIVETYIQEVKPDAQMGIVPKTDYYFLGQADFLQRLKVHSSIDHGRKSSLMCRMIPRDSCR